MCFFFPEELSQLEHLIRHQRKEEFPLSVFVPESKRVSQGGEGEGEGEGGQTTHRPDDISIKLELHKNKDKIPIFLFLNPT